MPDLLDIPTRPPTRYLRKPTIMRRYGISQSTFYRLCHQPDPLLRFPKPVMVIASFPLWAESDLIAYEKAHGVPR